MAKEQVGSSIGYQSKTVERVEDDSEDGRNEGGCRIAGILESSIVATQRQDASNAYDDCKEFIGKMQNNIRLRLAWWYCRKVVCLDLYKQTAFVCQ